MTIRDIDDCLSVIALIEQSATSRILFQAPTAEEEENVLIMLGKVFIAEQNLNHTKWIIDRIIRTCDAVLQGDYNGVRTDLTYISPQRAIKEDCETLNLHKTTIDVVSRLAEINLTFGVQLENLLSPIAHAAFDMELPGLPDKKSDFNKFVDIAERAKKFQETVEFALEYCKEESEEKHSCLMIQAIFETGLAIQSLTSSNETRFASALDSIHNKRNFI